MSYNPQFAKLGEILVNENIVSEAQLDKALSEQKTKKDKIKRSQKLKQNQNLRGSIQYSMGRYCERK